MLGSSIIDIAIGLVFIYLLLSLICSAANEIVERFSRKRARDLEKGISEMLHSDNPDAKAAKDETAALVKSIYEHPLIYSLFAKPYSPGAKTLPSYIPARNFALALMDLIGEGAALGATGLTSTGTGADGKSPAADAISKLRTALAANTSLPPKVKKALLTFVDASNDPAKVRENIENWFDSSMDRVSGYYKRRSQLIVLIFGLVLTILLNVDSIALMRTLSTDRPMRDSLVAAATEYAKANPTPTSTNASETTSESSTKTTGSASNQPTNPGSAGSSNTNSNRAGSSNTNSSPTSGANSNRAGANSNSSSSNSNTTSNAGPSAAAKPTPTASTTPCDTPECRVKNNLAEIQKLGLPIGWTTVRSDRTNPPGPADPRQIRPITFRRYLPKLLGWLITALALSLGAPFWFDLLNKFIVIRSTVKPKEKSLEEGSKDKQRP